MLQEGAMLKKLLYFLNYQVEYILCGVTFSIFIVVTMLQVIFRFVLDFSLSWTEELARYAFIYMVYFSVSLAVVRNRHVRVEIIDIVLPQKFKNYFYTFTDIVTCLFFGLVGWKSIEVMLDYLHINQITPALLLPLGWVYIIIPLGFFLTAFRIVQTIYRRFASKNREE
jgi:TRAP-type C4-dicarboxylate transport system permease small subunit